MAGATVVKLAYGHETLMNDDSYIKLAAEAFADVVGLGLTGLAPVDLFPICKLHYGCLNPAWR